MSDKRAKLIADLEPLAQRDGLELVDIELVGSTKAPTVRIFLDSPEGNGSITFDQIMGAHAWIDSYMDEADPFPGAYTLEVSSPGIDRPLRLLEHYEKAIGETVKVQTTVKPGRSKWTGTLVGVDRHADDKTSGDDAEAEVILEVDGKEERIPFALIAKARLKGRIDFNDGKDQ